MPSMQTPAERKKPSRYDRIRIGIMAWLLRSRLMPLVVMEIDAEERRRRAKEFEKEVTRAPTPEGVSERWRHGFMDIKVPCVFNRVAGGRKPMIELRITPQILERLTSSTGFERALMDKTIDVIFRLPQDMVTRSPEAKAPAPGGIAVAPAA